MLAYYSLQVSDAAGRVQAVNGARLLPVAADVTLAGCAEPNAQLFHSDPVAQGVQPGKVYCIYTSGGWRGWRSPCG